MASGGPSGPSYSAVLSGGAAAFSLAADSYPGRMLPHTRPVPSSRHSHDHSRRPQDLVDIMAAHLETESTTPFFIPSYLRGSRHAERLREADKAKKSGSKDARSTVSSNTGSLSTSSSSVNIHKMVPSHRGMTHEIIERIPAAVDEPVPPLPTRWSMTDKAMGLEVVSTDGLDIKLVGPSNTKTTDEAFCVRADHPMPKQCGIYYYEVTILSKGKDCMIGIGFSGRKVTLNRLTGWEPDSWAYHGDDGHSFSCQATGKDYGPKFSNNDIIGCCINFLKKTAFFTRNGVKLKTAFKDIKIDQPLYPSVGMKRPGEHIRVNFGQTPFVFDIDSEMEEQKAGIFEDIAATSTSTLASSYLDETSLIQALISQYLAHDGYVDTAKEFAREVNERAQALSGGSSSLKILEADEDNDAFNRQKIRSALLEGDVDKALKLTDAFYPKVLQENEGIYFQLRRRKFIEMVKKINQVNSTSKRGGTNGHTHDYDGVFDHQMELDEQLNVNNSNHEWDRMETEEADSHAKIAQLTFEVIQYGQVLNTEFAKDPRQEVHISLEAAFALMAYPEPSKSPVASLLDDEERVIVAEELNSAILVSLGKASSAALERLCQQTEVLVDELSEDGGAGAFVNVRKDFLRSEKSSIQSTRHST